MTHSFPTRRSSDLLLHLRQIAVRLGRIAEAAGRLFAPFVDRFRAGQAVEAVVDLHRVELFGVEGEPVFRRHLLRVEAPRSEEHTSELQSLMRISYAVFCLKKNKTETAHMNI